MEASNIQQSNPSEDNTMIDTVTLATQEREKAGLLEVKVSYGGEMDLHRHYDNCVKNPGHKKFVPVDQFNVDHLPLGYQDKDLVDLVLVMSDLTVRVSVTYVSEMRPDTFPGSDKPYPCYKKRGDNMSRVGTGYVNIVLIFKNQTCECSECLNSPTPKTQFAQIHLSTATHVVYDKIEGAQTTCHLFFDRGGAPDSCSGAIALRDFNCMGSPTIDSSTLVYWTHDLDLADRLLQTVNRRVDLMRNLKMMYSKRYSHPATYNQQDSKLPPELCDNVTIIISHPHGCSKQISVGRCTERKVKIQVRGDESSMYKYTTATCPGSSGAPIFIVSPGWLNLPSHNVHGGQCEDNKELNQCTYAADLTFSDVRDADGLSALVEANKRRDAWIKEELERQKELDNKIMLIQLAKQAQEQTGSMEAETIAELKADVERFIDDWNKIPYPS